jgi:hypothetical protein
MVGKKSSLKAVAARLRSIGALSIQTTRLVQGKTSRWAIAWSFQVFVPVGQNVVVGRKEDRTVDQRKGASAPMVDKTFGVLEVSVPEAERRIAECMNSLLKENEEKRGEWKTNIITKYPGGGGSSIVAQVAAGAYNASVRVMVAVQTHGEGRGQGSTIQISGNVSDHPSFERFCSRLEKDVRRTGRQWRRKLKSMQQEEGRVETNTLSDSHDVWTI